jgi:hypothetical protein
MDYEKKFKEETGFEAYEDNNLRPKVPSDIYVEWLEKQLYLCNVVGLSEQLVCDECNGWGYTVDENGRRKAHCTKCD